MSKSNKKRKCAVKEDLEVEEGFWKLPAAKAVAGPCTAK
jgi:hypothetical protein